MAGSAELVSDGERRQGAIYCEETTKRAGEGRASC